MKKKNIRFIIVFLTPALCCFLLLFLYPIFRTTLMSFFKVSDIGDGINKWEFVGLGNYITLFTSQLFCYSLANIFKIWLFGGIITLLFALLYAVILTSGVKGKKFWRSAIYLPNTISAVALANMWLQYVYNGQYGLFKSFFSFLHIKFLATINWTDNTMIFTSMLIAYCFGCIGYFMLIVMAGIERIPGDLYESAVIDGATNWQKFTKITFPLIRNVFRTCVMLWTVATVNYFVWSRMFSSETSPRTITPVVYMYDAVFSTSSATATVKNVGAGTAVGVLMTLAVLIIYLLINKLFKEKEYEY